MNSEFTYMDYLNNNVMTLLDINTNCTYTALKFLSGENQELELLYNFLFKRQEEEYTTFENHSYFLSIFLRVGYNYLSLLLDKNLYREVIETSYSFLELITRYRIGGEKYQFLLIKSVAHFQLYNEKDINLQNLKLILEIDDKLHLYDSICAALKLYDIYI